MTDNGNRFYVREIKQQDSDKCYYQVCDRHYVKYQMTELAVSINLGSLAISHDICTKLNKEWNSFVRNPW